MPSLKAIASDLGVSHALVSRVLNNRMGTTRVSKQTRDAILKRAKELDYQPNPLAVALKKGRKGTVGVFLHGIGTAGTELSFGFIQAASQALSHLGLNLWLQFFEKEEEFLTACNQRLLRKIDGLIVAGLAHAKLQEKLREIQHHGLHVVTACHGSDSLFGPDDKFRVPNFQVDYERQCHLTTQHLIHIGCRRIAHFKNSPERHQGYLNAHREAGLEPDLRLVIATQDYRMDSGAEGMRVLMESGTPFDALAAQSDAQAAGAMHYLLGTGLPKEQWPKITGVDDSPIARHFCPVPLTSVTAEMQTSAQIAVDTLFRKIEGDTTPFAGSLIEPRLSIRQSTVATAS
jgi:LacI family transcriptional regulator